MTIRAFLAALALATAALTGRAADDENPYKTAKVGDFATYTLVTKVAGINIDGTLVQTVTAKSDKEATVKVTGTITFGGNKQEIPAQEQKIDLTKPLDPTKGANLPGGADAKVEKGKEGKEKIKLNGKEYDCTWTTYKVKGKAMGQEIDADVKVWMSKAVPSGMAKMTMTAEIAGQKMDMTMELKETGSKKVKE
ncbi:hypothetical protein [Frigoriglobus tundricola]|uniref:Uncharacterized protein n=1 Tax=Frigoriglobus tundricola TaxID=2774151 RepID=A0A6M5YJI0_9BACT|nr:hypothetical protein [Frigoriglobus tundricola]QJW93423.1 hypothetical protein FTUN_0929 [Frigoriglobus tundricola]